MKFKIINFTNSRYIVFLLYFLISIPCFAQNSKRPNVIVILSDDIGVGDIEAYRKLHSEKIILETPNIDAIAENGMLFKNAYAPAALCATSRYAIMTGNYNYRSPKPWGVWSGYLPGVFDDETLTLGTLMQDAGYQTAFFGKWHLGTQFKKQSNPQEIAQPLPGKKMTKDIDITKIVGHGPMQNGFEYSFTLPSGIQSVPYAVYENDDWYPLYEDSQIGIIDEDFYERLGFNFNKQKGYGDSKWDPALIGPLLINKVVNYISENTKRDKPFFMYYCTQAVHSPHAPPKSLDGIDIKGTTPSAHMDMIKELDVQMGMIVKELKAQGIYDNTVFIFTSDNGGLHTTKETLRSGHNPSAIYRGHKGTFYEGGNRVPFIVSWPSKIKKGIESDQIVIGTDIMATIAGLANAKLPTDQALDSYDLLPVMLGKEAVIKRPVTILQGGSGKQVMIIENGWKLVMQMDKTGQNLTDREPIALFNLNENPQEKEEQNLIAAEEFADKRDHLLELYNSIRDSKDATCKHI